MKQRKFLFLALIFVLVLSLTACKSSDYKEAVSLCEAGDHEEAAEIFDELEDYKDSADKAEDCRYHQALAELEEVCGEAIECVEDGDLRTAIATVRSLGDWESEVDLVRASRRKLQEAATETQLQILEAFEDCGELGYAALLYAELDHDDAQELSMAVWDKLAKRQVIAAGIYHSVGLRQDGTLVATGDNEFGKCNISDWTNIIAVSANRGHTVGLRADGTVVAVGDNEVGQCDVSGWTGIVAIFAAETQTVGLRYDGTVVATGDNSYGQCNVSGWTDIIAISAGRDHTLGLRVDGTVVAAGDNQYGQCDVSGWTDMVAIAAGANQSVGLCSDGTVIAICTNSYAQKDIDGIENWHSVVDVAANFTSYGLCSDGTVYATSGRSTSDVSDWYDIVQISAGDSHTLALCSDGTVLAVGWNAAGQCDVSDWTNIRMPRN